MGHIVHIDPSFQLALVRFTDGLDLEELFDTIRTLHEETYEPSYNILWDAQDIQELVLGPGDLHRLLDHLANRKDLSKNAREVVIVQRPLDFNIAQLYSVLAERRGYEVEVSWSMEQALTHLGLEELPEALRRPALDSDPV